MIAARSGTGSGWQTIIADLALILFMVAISGFGSRPAPAAKPPQEQQALLRAEPTALYRPGKDSPPLAQWLGEQPHDPRQRLTVIARFVPETGAAAAATAALDFAAQARGAGWPARIVLEPGATADLLVVLAFDDPAADWHDPCSSSAEGRSVPAGQREIACD